MLQVTSDQHKLDKQIDGLLKQLVFVFDNIRAVVQILRDDDDSTLSFPLTDEWVLHTGRYDVRKIPTHQRGRCERSGAGCVPVEAVLYVVLLFPSGRFMYTPFVGDSMQKTERSSVDVVCHQSYLGTGSLRHTNLRHTQYSDRIILTAA